MTTNTPAPAQDAVLTDDEILQVFADVVGNQEDDARFIDVDRDQAIRIARALLSKLRAPVADEQGNPNDRMARQTPQSNPASHLGDNGGNAGAHHPLMRLPAMRAAFRITELHGNPEPAKRRYLMVFEFKSAADMYAADDEWRAALASVPVAGEAIGYSTGIQWRPRQSEQTVKLTRNPQPEYGFVHAVYAAPQASEAAPFAPDWVNYRQGWADGLAEGNEAIDIARTALMEIADLADLEADQRGVIVNAALTRINEITSRAALSAQPGAQKYWLCCGSKDPNHPNRRAPDCFHPDRAKWGTVDQHSAAQKKEQ